MRIILSKSTQEAVETVVGIVLERLSSHPSMVMGLATGKTMEPVYKGLVEGIKSQSLKMDKTFFFMLDEYLGIDEGHPSSFKSYIKNHFMQPLKLEESQFAFPPTHLVPSGKAGTHYENLLKQSGGVDLQLLGIGVNGHVGFNEPGSNLNSRTRVIDLAAETINSNKTQFSEGQMPAKALSMGIGSIMDGKELLLLATGHSKANTIKYLLNHHDDESCPASFLKAHPRFTLVLDPEAASKISLNI